MSRDGLSTHSGLTALCLEEASEPGVPPLFSVSPTGGWGEGLYGFQVLSPPRPDILSLTVCSERLILPLEPQFL